MTRLFLLLMSHINKARDDQFEQSNNPSHSNEKKSFLDMWGRCIGIDVLLPEGKNRDKTRIR